MTKAEAKQAFEYFIDEWHRATCPDTPRGDLSFYGYYSWFQNRSPGHLRFRSSIGVREECYHWFAKATGQSWKE